jgi:hypothetical protein
MDQLEKELRLDEIRHRFAAGSKVDQGINYTADIKFLLDLNDALDTELREMIRKPSAENSIAFIQELQQLQDRYPMFSQRYTPVG